MISHFPRSVELITSASPCSLVAGMLPLMKEQYADKEHKFDAAYWYAFFVDMIEGASSSSSRPSMELSVDGYSGGMTWSSRPAKAAQAITPSIYDGYSWASNKGRKPRIVSTGYVPLDAMGPRSGERNYKRKSCKPITLTLSVLALTPSS